MEMTILEVIPKKRSSENCFIYDERLLCSIPAAQTKLPQSDANLHFTVFDKTLESLLQQGFSVAAQDMVKDSNSLKITPATITIMSDMFYNVIDTSSDLLFDNRFGNIDTSHLYSVEYSLITNEQEKKNITYNHYVMKYDETYDEIGIWTGEEGCCDDWSSMQEKLKQVGIEDIIIT